MEEHYAAVNAVFASKLTYMSTFLGLQFVETDTHRIIHQEKYILSIVAAHLENKNERHSTPQATTLDKTLYDPPTDADREFYSTRNLYTVHGAIRHALLTHPEIDNAIHHVACGLKAPNHTHWKYAQAILGYLANHAQYGLAFPKGPNALQLTAYGDTDMGNNPITRKSIDGHFISLNHGAVYTKCKSQSFVATSTPQAETGTQCTLSTQVAWQRDLMHSMRLYQVGPTMQYCDNTTAVSLAKNNCKKDQTRFIHMRYLKHQELVKAGVIDVKYIASADNVADIFTKPLSVRQFRKLRECLGIRRFNSTL
jgi:histone deacetylase 1/2